MLPFQVFKGKEGNRLEKTFPAQGAYGTNFLKKYVISLASQFLTTTA
jgi:hypothetical protein